MDCLHDALLERYLNGELDAAALCRLQQHGRDCKRCRAELAHWQFLKGLQRDENSCTDVPSGFSHTVMSKIEECYRDPATSLLNL